MKLKTVTNTVNTSEELNSLQFGIADENMGLILDILRNKMYRNPIATICREVMSNSRDANRESGRENTPIVVKIDDSLFSPGDLSISFIDNGIGISPDRMKDVFINYGSSTKRDNNKQTGGFGLGAKTPFAYTDNFSIITIHNGVKYTYTAAIDDTNHGKIFLFEQEKTDEMSGTSIIVPIKRHDLYDFKKETMKVSHFWKIRPVFQGFDTKQESLQYKEVSGIYVIDNMHVGYFNQNAYYLLIDGIPYPIDKNIVNFQYHYGCSMFFPFRTGTLTISANREDVQYDKSTIKKIQDKYNKLVIDLKTEQEKRLKSATNYLEAAIIKENIKSSPWYNFLKSNKADNFSWKGQDVDLSLKLNGFKISKISQNGNVFKTEVLTLQKEMQTCPVYFVETKLTPGRHSAIFEKLSTPFYYVIEYEDKDIKKFRKEFRWNNIQAQIDKWTQEHARLKKNVEIKKTDLDLIDKKDSEKWSKAKKEYREIENEYEKASWHSKLFTEAKKNLDSFIERSGAKIQTYSDVIPVKNAREKKKRQEFESKELKFRRFESSNIHNLKLTRGYQGFLELKAENSKRAYYITKNSAEFLHSSDFRNVKKWAKLIEHIFNIKIMFINSSYLSWLKEAGCIPFEEMQKRLKNEYNTQMRNISDFSMIQNCCNESADIYKGLKFNFKYWKANLIINSIYNVKKVYSSLLRLSFPENFEDIFPYHEQVKNAIKDWNEIKKVYPLLSFLDSYSKDTELKDFQHYINLMDKEFTEGGD